MHVAIAIDGGQAISAPPLIGMANQRPKTGRETLFNSQSHRDFYDVTKEMDPRPTSDCDWRSGLKHLVPAPGHVWGSG